MFCGLSWQRPSCSSRVVAAFLCATTVSLVASPATSDAQGLTVNDIFPVDRLVDVQITVDEDDWSLICNQKRNMFRALSAGRKNGPLSSPYTYVSAKVVIDGVDMGQVGIRKKGFLGSQSDSRPSLKVKLNYLDKDAEIDGFKTLTLNNNQQDFAQVSQFLGYRIFNSVGSPAPRCALAKVTLNGENLGVYSHVESGKKPLVKRSFGSSEGTLYEGTVVDFFSGWDRSFERKFGDEDAGLEKINQLIKVLESPFGPTLVSTDGDVRAFVPTDDRLGKRWTQTDFDDSTWLRGKGSPGYDTRGTYKEQIGWDLKDKLFKKQASMYLRVPFEIDRKEDIAQTSITLRIKYDDGFVAYLNGHEIASKNAPKEPTWDSKAKGLHGGPDAPYEEFDLSDHVDSLLDGKNVLAIHGMNIDTTSSDMMIDAQIRSGDPNFEQAVGEIVDLDLFYKYWAVEGLLGFWDGYSGNRNNFFVYLNPKTDKLCFMPWGADCMFQKHSKIKKDHNDPVSVKTGGRLAHVLYQLPSSRARYAQTMRDILDDHWDEEELLAEVDRIEEMVKPHLADKQLDGFKVNAIRYFIRRRRGAIMSEMKDKMPLFNEPPKPPPVLPYWSKK